MPEWTQKELLVIRDQKSEKKEGAGWKIRLCQYILDGVSKAVKLESGEYWVDQGTGQTRYKTKGFSKRDLESCKPHWKEILRLMENPPPVGEVQQQEPDAPEDTPF